MTTTAVVTGAGRGIGARIARLLAARGMHVIATDIDETAAKATATAVGGTGLGLDVRNPAEHRAVAAAATAIGSLRVWVNNAGVLHTAPAWAHGDEDVRRMVEVNLLGTVYGCRAAVDVMQRGDIVNLSSLSAHGPTPGLGVYGATKAAVTGFSLSLAGDLRMAGRRIRVHALCPDATETDMVREVAGDPASALLFTGGGLLDPEAVARAAVDLVGRRRLVRSMPASRTVLLRISALLPRAAIRMVLPGFVARGRKGQSRDRR